MASKLKLYNTLSRNVEEFSPINPPNVGMYTCGPTPYDYQHIGNFRTAIFSDILSRTLVANDFEVKSVRNITDIDDKIIKKSAEKKVTPEELTKEYIQIFFEDLLKLNILPVNISPKATEHIEAMIKYIEVLISKGFAYLEEDGSVYFDISKFPDYGKLSRLDKRELKTGTRILSDEYDKDNIQDFALWKGVGPDEFGYSSPWGKGRPGWHIECSVMSQQNLGDTFDIHAGGIDLLFPHHENEIAQSEAKTGQPFVNYFIHCEHLLVDNKKMSKSLNNFYTLKDLEAKGFEPLAFRYLVLTAHYRDKLNFSWQSLESAQHALNNLRETVRGWEMVNEYSSSETRSNEQNSSHPLGSNNNYLARFVDGLNNDLNTSMALATLHELVKSDLSPEEKGATILAMDKILGLRLEDFVGKKAKVPDEVMKLVEEREDARKNKDFEKSDNLRKEIKKLGFEVKDTPSGSQLKRIS
jgi:cysteinyl-tRNA synthetase